MGPNFNSRNPLLPIVIRPCLECCLVYTEEFVLEAARVLTWSMILVSAENRLRISPRGVVSKNLDREEIKEYGDVDAQDQKHH